VEVLILGPVEVSPRQSSIGSAKQRALLALLAIHAGKVLSTDRILAELWPDAAPASGARALRTLVYELRNALRKHGEADALVTARGGYALQLEPHRVDAIRFEHMIKEARAVSPIEPHRAAELLQNALGLWRDDPLLDVDDLPFKTTETARLEQLRLDALEARFDAELRSGGEAAVVAELEELTLRHPLRERLHAQLMTAQYRLGRQADALRTAQQLKRALAEELGIDPGHEIKELEERILLHDPGLMEGSADRHDAPARLRSPSRASLLILPFDHGAGERDRLIAEGISEDLIRTLASLKGLRVVSRASSFALERHGDIPQAARTVRAETTLTGNVRTRDDDVQVSAELLDASGYVLWSERFERGPGRLFELQVDLALAVASALGDRIGHAAMPHARRPTDSAEAYDAFLEGRSRWHEQTEEGFAKAVLLFERAVTLDPSFAKAHAWLAIVHAYRTLFGFGPPEEMATSARREAEEALRLDPTLSEAHLAEGCISQYADWDWDATERHYGAAIELAPGDPTAHVWFAVFLARMGRVNEALAYAAEAVDLDPLGHEPLWLYQTVLLHLGRYTEALAIGRKAVAAHPHSTHTQGAFGSAYLGAGEPEAALEWLARSEAAASGRNPVAAAWRVRALAQAGRDDEARAGLQALVRLCREGGYPPTLIAFASVGLGDAKEAVSWLQIAVAARDPLAVFANWAGLWPLAEEPEYQALLRQLNLPDLSRLEETAVPARG
jgi:DNA-binding SARP family transcriptional activator/Flp pilus assembly protein TadD